MGFVTLRRQAVELGIHSLGKLIQFGRMKLNAWCCCVRRAISVRGNVRRITAVRGVFAIMIIDGRYFLCAASLAIAEWKARSSWTNVSMRFDCLSYARART